MQIIREDELRRRLISEGQVAEFAVYFDEELVLIDVKSIEGGVVTDGLALRELTVGAAEWDHPRWGSNVLTAARMLFPLFPSLSPSTC